MNMKHLERYNVRRGCGHWTTQYVETIATPLGRRIIDPRQSSILDRTPCPDCRVRIAVSEELLQTECFG